MLIRFLLIGLLWLAAGVGVHAQDAADTTAATVTGTPTLTLDQRIDAAVKPVSDAVSGAIFSRRS